MEEELLFKNVTPLTLERQYQFNIRMVSKLILFTEIILVVIFGASCLLFKDDTFILTMLLIAGAVSCILFPIVYYSKLKSVLKMMTKNSPLQDENNIVTFTFHNSNMDIIVHRLGEFVSQSVIKYENLVKVAQSKNFLFVYTGISIAHILDGNCMESGNFNDLVEFLKSKMDKKFKTIKKLK